MNYNYHYKHIIIGDSLSGKSSYMNKLLYDTFSNDKTTTIGVDFGVLYVTINNKTLKNHVWDTAGQETFKSIIRSYYRNSDGCILTFDVTNRKSFENINKWIDELQLYSNYEKLSVIIIGNKIDLEDQRAVSMEEAEKLSLKYDIPYIEVSVKNDINIKRAFYKLINLISKKKKIVELIEDNYMNNKITTLSLIQNTKIKKYNCIGCKN